MRLLSGQHEARDHLLEPWLPVAFAPVANGRRR
jgi:hypothetical protein